MVLDTLAELLGEKEPKPNKFTAAMGELIRKAREEAGLSQEELARYIYRRRATVTDLENGKHEPDASTLALLAAALEKPIQYFYPRHMWTEIKPDTLSPKEKELLIHFRKAWDENIQQVIIGVVKVIAEFDPEEMLLDSIERIKNRLEEEEELKAIFAKKRNRK